MKNQKLVLAAVAGIVAGTAVTAGADHGKPHEVNCYGINGCGAHAKCSVSAEDLAAVRKLLGEKEYKARFGKSEAHSCGSHAKCGAAQGILNRVSVGAEECKAKGGFVVEGPEGRKVARKG